ncbi:hypothetical protein AMATHDRAFT_47310 [Amanita thiersii Skay4041]|uniref:Calcium uniporter protein, mitochondrial n=1 Tax=Amanita thiersii Skay4041 TaxID=703135 RepID=A0A2A9NSA3_9AGAR|nr:hypothetical protein AMATHDRAFT_47310 [Amanita thiersii Skay4041]
MCTNAKPENGKACDEVHSWKQVQIKRAQPRKVQGVTSHGTVAASLRWLFFGSLPFFTEDMFPVLVRCLVPSRTQFQLVQLLNRSCRVPGTSAHWHELQGLKSQRVTLCYRYASQGPSGTNLENEYTNVQHSRFLAEATPHEKWGTTTLAKGRNLEESDGFEDVDGDKGKLAPTSSHLFKLILPVQQLSLVRLENRKFRRIDQERSQIISPASLPPTVILLHPSQPLSHVSQLIIASLRNTTPLVPKVSFRSVSGTGKPFQWSHSTDVVNITNGDDAEETDLSLDVEVPTFADRTRFLRRRLDAVESRLHSMEKIKRQCDIDAHHGARRVAVGVFGMLIVYWAAVARLTFWDYGWDVMEPITYLSGLSTVICGYLWFLYQGHDMSYSSVLDRSISSRREALYKARGLDIDEWMDLVIEAKRLRKDIGRIAQDYDEQGSRVTESVKERKDEQVIKTEENINTGPRLPSRNK